MPFKYAAFEKILKKDNPTYERVLRSDLHGLVEELKKPRPSAAVVGKEMKKIKKQKWTKYANTKAYIFESFPELAPKLVKFGTKSLSSGGGGAIVHVLTWESSTGDLDDLAHVKVREHVSWKAPAAEVKPYVISEYQSGGRHYGQGNAAFTPGNVGQGDDTHAALGPFSPKVLEFEGPGELVYEMRQVYEMNEGGGWVEIPKSKFKITRTVSVVNGKVKLSITKEGKAGGSASNSVSL